MPDTKSDAKQAERQSAAFLRSLAGDCGASAGAIDELSGRPGRLLDDGWAGNGAVSDTHFVG